MDAGNSPAHVAEFYAALEEAGFPLPDMTVMTHWHWDHTFGASGVKGITVATKATNDILRRMGPWRWDREAMETRLRTGEDISAAVECICREYRDPEEIRVVPAQMELEGPLAIDLGGVTCRLIPQDSPHSRDALFLYIPEERVLAVGDGESGDYYDLGGAYAPQKLAALLAFLEGLDYDLALSGHQPPWTKEAELTALRGILERLQSTF